MAIFNPNVPDTQDPNYLSYSRGISQPEGSKAIGTALSAVGSTIDAAVKGIDFINKDAIDKSLYSEIDAERDAYTQALQDTLTPVGQAPADKRRSARETESYQAMDILPTGTQASIPTDLQNLPRTIGNLAGGYNNGKISNTYYYGRLNSIAKDMRSRYPGYREYIDKQISEVTGINPANAYLTSMVGDINTALSQARSEKDKTLALIDKYIGIPGAPQIRQGFQNGTISDAGVRQWVHNREVLDNYYDLKEKERRYNAGTRTEQAVTATANMNAQAHTDVALHMDTITLATMGDGTGERLLERIASGKPLSGPDATLAAQELQRQKAVMEQKLWAKFNKTVDGQSLVDAVGGPEKAKQIIADNLKVFDNFTNLMVNAEYGQANQAAKRAKALIDDQKLRALNDGNIGKPLVMLDILRSTAGEPFVAQYYKTLLSKGFSQDFINYTEALELPLMTQPGVNRQGSGTVTTGNDALTKARQAGVDTPEMTKVIVDRLASIADPTIPIETRLNLARAAFSEGNRGFISRFALDDVQITQDGRRRIVPGRIAVFQQLTSPQMTQEMMKISGKHPDLWRDYVNWTTHTFGNELFRREINELKTFQRMEGVTVSYSTGEKGGAPRFKVEFQEDRMSGLRPAGRGGPANPVMATNPLARRGIEESVARLNQGLAGVYNVLKNNGEDTEGYLLQTLSGMNVDFTGQSFGGNEIKGLPEDFRQAIINSRRPPVPAPRPAGANRKQRNPAQAQ